MRTPPCMADSWAHKPVMVPVGRLCGMPYRKASLVDRRHEFMDEMRVRAPVPSALYERGVLVLFVVHARLG